MYDLSLTLKLLIRQELKVLECRYGKEEISGYFLNFKLKSSVNSIIACIKTNQSAVKEALER
jgi:hypothetical protein